MSVNIALVRKFSNNQSSISFTFYAFLSATIVVKGDSITAGPLYFISEAIFSKSWSSASTSPIPAK